MTTTETRSAGTAVEAQTGPVAPARHRRPWILGACAAVMVTAILGYLVGNEIQANTQFDQAHHALESTRHQITIATGDLTAVHRNLTTVSGQVSVDTTTLAGDVSKLAGARSALAAAQADVARQATTETALHGCLGGVEQALNALALGDQTQAINALNAVAPSCTSAGVDVG